MDEAGLPSKNCHLLPKVTGKFLTCPGWDLNLGSGGSHCRPLSHLGLPPGVLALKLWFYHCAKIPALIAKSLAGRVLARSMNGKVPDRTGPG